MLLLLTVLVISSATAGGSAQNPGAPMNTVLLVIDDTRWDSIGAAGNTIVRTPRIDQLASEGIRFTQARVVTAICMTSRASLLTGQYMSRHGIDRFGAKAEQKREQRVELAIDEERDELSGDGPSRACVEALRDSLYLCATTLPDRSVVVSPGNGSLVRRIHSSSARARCVRSDANFGS